MGPDLFFSDRDWDGNTKKEEGRRKRVAKAKAICESCSVQNDCLEWAIVYLPYGFAGGKTEKQRERLARIRKREGHGPEQAVG